MNSMYPDTLALAMHWGRDAAVAGLDRDTIDVDREAIRAMRDAAHDDGHGDAYTVTESAIRAAWVDGYDS